MVLLMARDAEEDGSGIEPESLVAKVWVAKNRNGPIGDTELVFFPKFTRFEDCAMELSARR